MSFERAYKNCKLCFAELSRSSPTSIGEEKNSVDLLIGNEYARRSMNEAMKALEGHIQNVFPYWIQPGLCIKDMEIAESALRACVECDFKRPCIADLLRPEIFKNEEGLV